MKDSKNISVIMRKIGENARVASQRLANTDTKIKNNALHETANILRYSKEVILSDNHKDLVLAEKKGISAALLDRLSLDEGRIEAMAKGLEEIAILKDPIGTVISQWDRPNGLIIQRRQVPIGVIGVIFESRPNVTADAGALCLKAGNAVILRSGSDSFYSSSSIHKCFVRGLISTGLPGEAIQLVPKRDRAFVSEMLSMIDYIDVIVPRGGKSLVEIVNRDSKVPVFKHLEGICHTYIDCDASHEMAIKIVLNAKMRRPGICGATETVLIDRKVAPDLLPLFIKSLIESGCEVRGEKEVMIYDSRIVKATEEDWSTEYLDAIISIKLVGGVDEAIEHIQSYGSNHTDAIITENVGTSEVFVNKVDSAIVIINASTQFADGGEFGMGAEIGISTGKLHARGPVGVEQLTSFKYVVRGSGQCRP